MDVQINFSDDNVIGEMDARSSYNTRLQKEPQSTDFNIENVLEDNQLSFIARFDKAIEFLRREQTHIENETLFEDNRTDAVCHISGAVERLCSLFDNELHNWLGRLTSLREYLRSVRLAIDRQITTDTWSKWIDTTQNPSKGIGTHYELLVIGYITYIYLFRVYDIFNTKGDLKIMTKTMFNSLIVLSACHTKFYSKSYLSRSSSWLHTILNSSLNDDSFIVMC